MDKQNITHLTAHLVELRTRIKDDFNAFKAQFNPQDCLNIEQIRPLYIQSKELISLLARYEQINKQIYNQFPFSTSLPRLFRTPSTLEANMMQLEAPIKEIQPTLYAMLPT